MTMNHKQESSKLNSAQPSPAKKPSAIQNVSARTAPGSNGSSVLGGSSWSNVSLPKSLQQLAFIPTPTSPPLPKASTSNAKTSTSSQTQVAIPTSAKPIRAPYPLPRQIVPEPPIPTPQPQSKPSSRSGMRSNSSRDKKSNRTKHSGSGRTIAGIRRNQATPYPIIRNRVRVALIDQEASRDGKGMQSVASSSKRGADHSAQQSPAKATIPIRRPTPAPPSSSSSSASSSESYVSLRESVHHEGDRHDQQAVGPSFPTDILKNGGPQIFDRRQATAAFFSQSYDIIKDLDPIQMTVASPSQQNPDPEKKEPLLLPEELDRVRTWSAEVESHRGDLTPLEEDEILPDGEIPVRFDNVDLTIHDSSAVEVPRDVGAEHTERQSIKLVGESDLERHPSEGARTMSWFADMDRRQNRWTFTPARQLPFSSLLREMASQRFLGGSNKHPNQVAKSSRLTSSMFSSRLAPIELFSPRPETASNYPTPVSVPVQTRSPFLTEPDNGRADRHESKDDVSLISPSPFSPLPSPLKHANQALATPSQLEGPLPAQSPSLYYESEVSFAMAASPRPYSPVVPPRIQQSPSPGRRSSSDSSTEFDRGRSPTRRSWKGASSNRSTYVRNAMGMMDHSGSQGRLTTLESTSLERPRTSSRSPNRTNASVLPRPDTVQTVSTTELFYNPQVRTLPVPSTATKPLPFPTSTARSSFIIQSPISELSKPNPSQKDNESRNYPANPLLRVPRAPRSVISLPPSEIDSVVIPSMPPVMPLNTPTVTGALTIPPRTPAIAIQSPLGTTSGFSRGAVGPYLAPISLPPTTPQVNMPAVDPSKAFMKVLTMVNSFTSDVSDDQQGLPRWKSEHPAIASGISAEYKNLYEGVKSTRVDFRPWMRSWKTSISDERMLVEAVDTERGLINDDGTESHMMYIEDVLEMLHSPSLQSHRGAREVVESELICSVIATWEHVVMASLQRIRELLACHFASLVSLHFPHEMYQELHEFAQCIVEAQIQETFETVTNKLHDLVQLECSHPSAPTSFVRSHTTANLLSHYKGLRHQAQKSFHQRRAADHNSSKRPSSPPAGVQSISPSRPALSESSSRANTQPSSHDSTRQARLRPVNTAIARLRQFSLIGSDSFEYVNDMKQALTSLSNLGFKDVDPEKLYTLFSEHDPTDEALEVMARVDSHFTGAYLVKPFLQASF
ncbi:hypothetical protein FRC02_003721 [Tulasnella sp. 418]|nr:hypothetical protein FRC02_003721 [Tulasnella sp. 418]